MESASAASRPLRLDLPIRTSKRKKDARSPQQQLEMAQACAQVNGYIIDRVHDSGRDESGKTMNRASLNAIMARVEAGEIDGMIVALADRLGRAPIEEAMAYVRKLTGVGVLVLSDMGGFPLNLNDPAAETNLVVQLQMARQYWLMTANRFQSSQRAAIAEGKMIGRAPIGMVRVSGGRLVEDEHYGPTIVRAYEIAASDGLHAAVRYLKREVPDRDWTTSATRRVLACRLYLGEMHHGEHTPNLHAHDRLTGLTRELWTAAQTEARGRVTNGEYPLSKIAECPTCGAGLTGQLQTVREVKYRRMRCSNKQCPKPTSIGADALEGYVREWFKGLLSSARGKRIRMRLGVTGLDVAKRALTEATAERDEFVVLTSARHPSYAAGLARRDADVEAAQAHYDALAKQTKQSESFPTADELDDDEKLLAAIRLLDARIVVLHGRRGRHTGPVGDRVTILIEDLDDSPGVIAA